MNPVDKSSSAAGAIALDRGDLTSLKADVLHRGSATKAEVSRLRVGDQDCVIKDAHCQHPLYRGLWGRRVLGREARALQAVSSIEGVPRFLSWVDQDAFLQEYLEGVPMLGRLARKDPEGFRQAALDLIRVVERLHGLGVVHLDLRQRRNLLVRDGGKVAVLDFESAIQLKSTGLQGVILRILQRMDRSACLKFKAKYAADALTDADRLQLQRDQRWARWWFFHRFGPLLRRLLGRGAGGRDDENGDENGDPKQAGGQNVA